MQQYNCNFMYKSVKYMCVITLYVKKLIYFQLISIFLKKKGFEKNNYNLVRSDQKGLLSRSKQR